MFYQKEERARSERIIKRLLLAGNELIYFNPSRSSKTGKFRDIQLKWKVSVIMEPRARPAKERQEKSYKIRNEGEDKKMAQNKEYDVPAGVPFSRLLRAKNSLLCSEE